MNQIEHDPDEPPRDRTGNGIYWISGVFVAALAAIYFLSRDTDWWSLAVGASAGIFIASWAIGITDNKAPRWMRR